MDKQEGWHSCAGAVRRFWSRQAGTALGNCHCTRSCSGNMSLPHITLLLDTGDYPGLGQRKVNSHHQASWAPFSRVEQEEYPIGSWVAPAGAHPCAPPLPKHLDLHFLPCASTGDSARTPGSVIHIGLHCPYKQTLRMAVKVLLKNEVLTENNCECWRKNHWCGSESYDSQPPWGLKTVL